jgi:uncharacterized protein (DUF433 family)
MRGAQPLLALPTIFQRSKTGNYSFPIKHLKSAWSRDQSGFRIEVTILVDPAPRGIHNAAAEDASGVVMRTEYIQLEGDVYRITGSRVSLDSIVYAFWNGETAETIAQSFPVLTLEQVYGAITCYVARKEEIDRYLKLRRTDYDARRRAAHDADPMFYQKLAAG